MPEPTWPLVENGVSLLVSLSEHLPPHAGRRYAWGTSGEAQGRGQLMFLHCPIADGALPPPDILEVLVTTVVTAHHQGLRILLHCHEGRNRTGFAAALVLRKLTGCSGAQALDRIRQVRTGMVYNRTFATYLEQLPAPRA